MLKNNNLKNPWTNNKNGRKAIEIHVYIQINIFLQHLEGTWLVEFC